MPYGMYISAAGAQAQNQRLEVLTHNLANVDTPGFKRELAVIQARHSEAIERGEAQAGSGSLNDIGGGVSMRETVTDFRQGALKQTGVPTDLAIDGQEAFFQVQKDGEPHLTRAGNFHFAADGQLVSEQGYPVLSAGGQPVAINPALPYRFLENGVLAQGDVGIPLGLVKPASLGDLSRVGENLFAPLGKTTPLAAGERRVMSGYLEQSAVNPALEMMQLIEASRAYEANVRLIQNQDQMLGTLVNRVLRQS